MKVMAPRLPTPITSAGGRPGSHLPTDVLADQIERLKLFSLISGSMWFIGLLMDAFVFPAVFGQAVERTSIVIELGGVLTAVAIRSYVCYAPRSAQSRTDAGLWLMVLNAFGIALLETWAQDPSEMKQGQLSWITIVILLSAMITPSTPRKMMTAALVVRVDGSARHVGRPSPRRRRAVGPHHTRSCTCRITRAPSRRSCRRSCSSASRGACARPASWVATN